MTDDERKNRNPKPEAFKLNLADCPELHVPDLELHRVYILHGPRIACTLNYMGKGLSLNPITLDTVVTHHFRGPRANVDVFLQAGPGGTLQDGEGHKITLRKYTGPDQ